LLSLFSSWCCQLQQADVNAMAIDDPGNTKHEPEGST
jgi:hypothetical protein